MYNMQQPYLDSDNTASLFTPVELAEYLGIGRNKAYDLLRSNQIQGFRLGSTWRVSKAAVDQFILKNSKSI